MSYILSFPSAKQKVRILTSMMKYASMLTLKAHCNGGLVLWSGGVGRGKTWCAEWMVEELNAQYDSQNPDSFRLIHYEAGKIAKWSGREEKIALRSLYHKVIGPMDEGVYRTFPLEAIADMIVHGMRTMAYQIIFVDEAGRLSLNALDALVLVSNTAQSAGWPLTIVLIGMDDLPIKITLNRRIYSRICQKICFMPYTLTETWDLLAALEPHFASLDRNNYRHREQVELVHMLSGGNAREITSLVSRFAGMLRCHPDVDPMVVIRGAHEQPTRDERRIREDMGLTDKRRHRKEESEKSEKSVNKGKKGSPENEKK